MVIKLKTEEGMEFSFDTVDELIEFTYRMNGVTERTSYEGTEEVENEVPKTDPKFEVGDEVRVVENKSGGHDVGTIGEIREVNYVGMDNRWSYVVHPISGNLSETRKHHKESDLELSGSETKVEVGDKVRIVSSEDGSDTPYHYLEVGSVGKVVGKKQFGGIVVEVGGRSQCLLPHHYVKIEPLGKDVNGEGLYEGDYVTGSKENEYSYTGDKEVMEVLGYGESPLHEEANIQVKIDGDWTGYNVDSSKFIKLSDNLDEAKEKFKEIKGIGWVRRGEVEEHVQSSPKFRTGDIVRVTESFTDHFGDLARRGAVYSYDENFGFAEPFVGTVFLGDNIDKLVLVCRDEDRLDI